MRQFIPHSLAGRFTLLASFSTLVMFLGATTMLLALFLHRVDSHMDRHLSSWISFMTDSLAIPLRDRDMNDIQGIGLAIMQDHLVESVEILDNQGKTLFQQGKGDGALIEASREVFVRGSKVGTIALALNDTERQTTIRIVLVSGVCLATFVFLLHFLFHKILLKPLLRKPFSELDQMVSTLASGNFSPPPPEHPLTEFKPLIKLLGDMGTTINRQMRDLETSEERLSLAMDAANDGIWDWDVQSGKTFFSSRYYTMLGYDPGEFEASYESWRSLVHPQDIGRVKRELDSHLNATSPYLIEFRMRTKSGEWRWILSRGRVIERDKAGSPKRMAGTHSDITEHKLALEAILESERRFRTIFENAPYPITIARQSDQIFLDVNKAFMRTYGVTKEECLGKTLDEVPALRPIRSKDIVDSTTIPGKVFSRELQLKRPDGSPLYLFFSAVPISMGGEECTLSIAVDETERRLAVLAMQKSEERYRTIFNNTPVGIYRSTFQGRLLDVNPAMARMFGYDNKEEMLTAITNLAHDLYLKPEERLALLDALLESPDNCTRGMDFRRKDGSIIHTVVNVSLQFDEQGDPAYLDGTIEDVTKRREAELAQRQSEQRYRLLIENSPIAFEMYELRGHDLIITTANQAAHNLFNLTPEEMLERSMEDVHPVLKGTIYPMRYKEIARGAEPWSFEYLREEGTEIVFALSINAFNFSPGSLALFFIDIKAQKQTLRRLRQSEEMFSTLFRLSPDRIMLLDRKTKKIVEVNETFSRLSGYSREEVLGMTPGELGLFADADQRRQVVHIIDNDGSVDSLELDFMNKSGSIGTYSFSARTIPIGGKSYLLTMSRDITELKKMQEMMVQTEKMISVGGIAAGIAHEINNPLGIVLQAAQNLVQRTRVDFPKNLEVAAEVGLEIEPLDRYIRARKLDVFIDDIRTAALRASNIIRHLLDFSRRSESKRATCDLPAIVNKALALAQSDYDLKKRFDFKRIHVTLDISDDLPLILCTETEVEQVLLNLLRNAAQAMAEANPQVEDPRIAIRVSPMPQGVRLEVEDNGPGMPPEVRRRIFEPFYTTKPPGVGTGLGLSVSYFIITKGHDGKMSVESTPGMGTKFIIELHTE